MSYKTRTSLLIVFALLSVFFSGCTFLPIGKARKTAAAQKNRAQANEPGPEEDPRRVGDSQQAYATLRANPKAVPQIPELKGASLEYATSVYSGIFHEALISRDFDLLERAAIEARESKEKTVAGVWKLERIYDGLEEPSGAASEHEWQRHLALLQQWSNKKPDSRTAKIALALGHFKFGWKARGHDYADKVTDENRDLFYKRIEQARNTLTSMRAEDVDPKWYSLMLQIALSENWDRGSYDELF